MVSTRSRDRLLWSEIVRLVGNVIAELHLETRTKQPSIGHTCSRVPDLDNMKRALWRHRDTRNRFILFRQELPCDAMHHAIEEDCIRI